MWPNDIDPLMFSLNEKLTKMEVSEELQKAIDADKLANSPLLSAVGEVFKLTKERMFLSRYEDNTAATPLPYGESDLQARKVDTRYRIPTAEQSLLMEEAVVQARQYGDIRTRYKEFCPTTEAYLVGLENAGRHLYFFSGPGFLRKRGVSSYNTPSTTTNEALHVLRRTLHGQEVGDNAATSVKALYAVVIYDHVNRQSRLLLVYRDMREATAATSRISEELLAVAKSKVVLEVQCSVADTIMNYQSLEDRAGVLKAITTEIGQTNMEVKDQHGLGLHIAVKFTIKDKFLKERLNAIMAKAHDKGLYLTFGYYNARVVTDCLAVEEMPALRDIEDRIVKTPGISFHSMEAGVRWNGPVTVIKGREKGQYRVTAKMVFQLSEEATERTLQRQLHKHKLENVDLEFGVFSDGKVRPIKPNALSARRPMRL